ncbi:MAG: lamin tail domain-containing protein, partial [Bacteroidia bacterium]|nr:lamin tail domain-containing protein [Bacteroidia bacterium]
MGVSSFPSLNNTGDNLKLKNSSLVDIDSVNYSDTWYQDVVKLNGGWTLELINPNINISCSSAGNWIASNHPSGGTPGTTNSVHNTTPDTNPPLIISAAAIDATHVTICFNEGLDITQASILSNYSINNGIGIPAAVTLNPTLTCVELTLATPMTSATTYTVTINNVSDCSGNGITNGSVNYTYYAISPANYKDVIINEIFADPSPQIGLPTGEFIEIYNKSSTNAYNLNGWKFTDGSSTATLSSYVLTPNSYLIICPTADISDYSVFGPTMGVGSFPSLNNNSDNLKLQDNTLTIIDSVNYSDTWYQDAVKKDGGYTLELINPNKPFACPQNGNWIASNSITGGTPGIINSIYNTTPDIIAPTILNAVAIDSARVTICFSEAIDAIILNNVNNYFIDNAIGNPLSVNVNSTLSCVTLTLSSILNVATFYNVTISNIADCSGNTIATTIVPFSYYKAKPYDIVINEIMADPDPIFSSLPNYEYVELYNRTPYSINLNGWKFTAGTNTKTLPDVTISANGYIVLVSTTAAPNYPLSYNVTGVTSFPALTNSGQTLSLKTPQNNIISTVSYNDTWYKDNTKKEGGWSLEQIDPNNPCAGIENWRASVSTDAGTPGSINSVNANNPDVMSPQVTRVSVIAFDTIQLYFNESIDSTTLLNLTAYNIDNGIGNPVHSKPITPEFKSVCLALSSPLQNDFIYTITISSTINDCVGNTLGIYNSARFAIPKTAQYNDVVINEILVDPKTGGVDFVEIYNRSNKVIDLKTITLSQYDTINNTLTSIKTISADGYLIFPSEYLVLSSNSTIVKSQYFTQNPSAFLDMPSMITMNISGGTVCIARQDTIIDLLKYYENMHFALIQNT